MIESDRIGSHVAELASGQKEEDAEEDAASPNSSSDSAEGCFSFGVLTHTTDQCRTLDESFPFCLRDDRRSASETSSFWDRVLKRCP